MSKNRKSAIKDVEEQIKKIERGDNVHSIGHVVLIQDYILYVSGLDNAFFYEKVNIGNNNVGYVVKIEPSYVVVSVIKKEEEISVGTVVYETNEILMGEFSLNSMGRIIDMFGFDKLNNKKYQDIIKLNIESTNIPIYDRKPINRPLLTGISGIDLIYPIGRGQRQLIIGDKKTGKTQICLDTIANQADKKVICLYNAIGKTKKEVKQIYYELLKRNAMSYTTIITSFYDDSPSVITLTPYYTLSVAELYMKKGFDVLVILDDLKKHADAYRQISLISGKIPGRDAYPADIFYFHSRLLEKGCQYKNGASITILPIMETTGGDITDYISTNIISITDGQIVLSSKNYDKGEKPAIDYGLSVSRLGGAVQQVDMKKLGAKVRNKLLTYLETREVYELANVDEMSPELYKKLFEGKKIVENLMQYKFSPLNEKDMLEKFKFIEEENHD